jgi:hypothetical protein
VLSVDELIDRLTQGFAFQLVELAGLEALAQRVGGRIEDDDFVLRSRTATGHGGASNKAGEKGVQLGETSHVG